MKKVLLGSLITLVLVLTLAVGCVGGVIAAPYLQQQLATFKIVTPAPVSLGARPALAPTPAPKLTPPPTATLVPLPEDASAQERIASDVYRKVSPSVVYIRVVSKRVVSGLRPQTPNLPQLPDLPPTGIQQASGSGFVLDKDGHILTNNHVVEGADKIEVKFLDGTVVRAKLVGADPYSDLAVIRVDVESSRLQPVELGDSSALVVVGQQVFAIGNPFGQQWTLTSGIVSAVGRTIQSGASRYSIPEAVQTDASINPGNSGGPLLDSRGRVIGVNSQIISENGSSSGVGFAAPVNIVKRVAPALIKDGRYDYAWLGIQGGALTLDVAEAMNLAPDQRGAWVIAVIKGSPAEKAGVRGSDREVTIDGDKAQVGGDVIIAVDGQPIQEMDDVIAYLVKAKRPGDSITLTVLRDGQQKEIQVTLGERPRS